jgi:Yip1 domain
MAWIPGRRQKNNGRVPAPAHKAAKKARNRDSDPTYWPDFGFIPPSAAPLPLREAIRQLPEQYKRVVTKPYAETFLGEMGQADWGIIWVQILGYAIIAALLGFLGTLIPAPHATTPSNATGLSSPAVIRALTLGTSLGLIILIPVLFFLLMGILYLLARAYGGRGRFVRQCYTTLLFLVPFGLAVSILGLLPFVGSFFSAFLGAIFYVYSIVLQSFANVAVHRLTGGKATATAVITALLLIPLAVGVLSLWTFLSVPFS